MTKNLFNKAAIFTDLHFGHKNNSEVHNADCADFVRWMVAHALQNGCETCLFLGDFHSVRSSMNLRTMDYVHRAMELLNDSFQHTYFIPGNHDLFYRDRRDIFSTAWAKHLTNITICNNFVIQGNAVIAPWLLDSDVSKIRTLKGQYLFGHLELGSFYMNSQIQMPEHEGGLKISDFTGFDQVFSGHFHKRQTNGNISYMGNCFPLNYSDVNDDERGMMILEWGGEPQYHAWPDQPTFRVYNLSDVIANSDALLKPRMHIRANVDVEIGRAHV